MEKAQPASVHHKAYPHLTDQETLKSINVDSQMVCSAYLEGALWNLEFTKTKKKSLAYLSKRCIEVYNIDFRLQIGGFEWTCHSKNTTAMIPLDTNHIHLCVNTHWVWRRAKQ